MLVEKLFTSQGASAKESEVPENFKKCIGYGREVGGFVTIVTECRKATLKGKGKTGKILTKIIDSNQICFYGLTQKTATSKQI